MNHSQNPSAIQSKEWIMHALISLMQEKQYQEITITEIAEKAGIVRRTFYRNFCSKEDVLESYLEILFQTFSEQIALRKEVNCDVALRILFRLCKENSFVFLGLSHSNMLGLMFDKWNHLLPILHQVVKDKIKQFPQTKDEKSLEYLLTFNVGGVFHIIIKWMDEGMKLSPDELADIVFEFAFGSLIQIS